MSLFTNVLARVKSISTSNGLKPSTKSVTMSILINGICVPIYLLADDLPVNLIPHSDEYIKVDYKIKHDKIYIDAYKRRSGEVYSKF